MQLEIACLKTMVTKLCFNICDLEDSWLTIAEVKDLPSQIQESISDSLQYSCLHWSDHLCFHPGNRDQQVLASVLGGLKLFFEGLYPLFWVEVLGIMGMVQVGARAPRRLISWVRVSMSPTCCQFALQVDLN